MIVTESEIEVAQEAAEQAAQAYDAAEAKAVGRGPIGDELAASLGTLHARARQASRAAEELRTRRAQQQAALAERAERETANAAALASAAGELTRSRARLLSSVASAEKALLQVIADARSHDALVQAKREALIGVGLRVGDVDSSVDHDSASGERVGVRVRGTWWGPVDAGGVLTFVAGRVAASTFGRFNLLTQRLATMPGVTGHGGRIDALLADLPELPEHQDKPRWRPPARQWDQHTAGGEAPYLARAELKRLSRSTRGPGDAA